MYLPFLELVRTKLVRKPKKRHGSTTVTASRKVTKGVIRTRNDSTVVVKPGLKKVNRQPVNRLLQFVGADD